MKQIKAMSQKTCKYLLSLPSAYKHYLSSIRFKIIVLVAVAILIPLSLFGTYMYSFIYNNILTQHMNNELKHSMEQVNDSLVSKFRIIDNTFNLFLSNQDIRANLEELSTREQTYYLKAKTKLEIETQLKYNVLHDYAWNSGLLKSVFVFFDEENYYYLLYNYLPNEKVLKDHIRFYDSSEEMTKRATVIKPSPYFNTIYLRRDIKTLITKNSIGELVLGIDEEMIYDAYHNIIKNKSWKAFVFDYDGTIFFHTDRGFIGEKIDERFLSIANANAVQEFTVDGIVYIIDSKKISDMNMTSVIMVPKTEFTSNLNELIPHYLYIIVFSVLFSVIISMFIITSITKPIKDLILHIESVNHGNFEIKMPEYKYSELNEVSTTFNDMIDKIQYLFNEVYKHQILLTESELKALQAQINPHFLFNVLETISWEARMSNNEKIYKMVNSLGKLLRASLTFSSHKKIRLREELEYVEFYLYLQKMRFGDKLMIDISISDITLLDFYLPKLCIQPIVENAVIHGLENKIEKGNVSINISREYETIRIKVTDDGIGFDISKLNIDAADNTDIGRSEKHIGLMNVNKRIKLMYGSNYGLSVESKINEGTVVSIYMPFDRGDHEHVSHYDCG
ncbi:MAG: sensor histidine kinase [Bacillota bacterium]